jgi:hypothetical protein
LQLSRHRFSQRRNRLSRQATNYLCSDGNGDWHAMSR